MNQSPNYFAVIGQQLDAPLGNTPQQQKLILECLRMASTVFHGCRDNAEVIRLARDMVEFVEGLPTMEDLTPLDVGAGGGIGPY